MALTACPLCGATGLVPMRDPGVTFSAQGCPVCPWTSASFRGMRGSKHLIDEAAAAGTLPPVRFARHPRVPRARVAPRGMRGAYEVMALLVASTRLVRVVALALALAGLVTPLPVPWWAPVALFFSTAIGVAAVTGVTIVGLWWGSGPEVSAAYRAQLVEALRVRRLEVEAARARRVGARRAAAKRRARTRGR